MDGPANPRLGRCNGDGKASTSSSSDSCHSGKAGQHADVDQVLILRNSFGRN
jgi:hypothetical protein